MSGPLVTFLIFLCDNFCLFSSWYVIGFVSLWNGWIILLLALSWIHLGKGDISMALLCFILLFVEMIYYNWLGSISSPSLWSIGLFLSPGGYSSCSNQPHPGIPYNPLGWADYNNINWVYQSSAIFCPFDSLRWSDPSTVVLTDPSQLNLNKGRGLLYSQHFVLCPGTIMTLNSNNGLGVGNKICSNCAYQMENMGRQLNTANCSDMANDLFCFICPGYLPLDSTDYVAFRVVCWLLIIWICYIPIYTLIRVVGLSISH